LVRYFFDLSDAKHLTVQLIGALAGTDDNIAKRLERLLEEIYDQGPDAE